MPTKTKTMNSYRCRYVPDNATFDSGVTKEIQVKAFDSADALQRAYRCIGRPIIEAVRFEPAY